jgi:hypothetical protein
MSIVLPPREVFELVIEPSVDSENDSAQMGGYGVPTYVKTVCPPEGGMYMYFVDSPYPFSTHPYMNAVKVNAIVKKQTLLLFQPFTKILSPTKFLENYLALYCRMTDSIYRSIPAEADGRIRIPYLKEQFYDPLCKELWRFLYHFLQGIGISEDTSYQFGKRIATVLQYDNAYREPLKDIFSETSKEKISRKEIKRLAKVFSQRVIGIEADKFTSIAKILNLALLIPKVNKAFYKALEKVDFKKFQQSKADYIHSLHRSDYNYGGRTWEVREAEYKLSLLPLNN